ncbi:MAG TPA: ATP-dependent Clp protease adaptor ClpS [Bacteroidota bacterium]
MNTEVTAAMMLGSVIEEPVIEETDETDVKNQEPAKVILFNDEVHTFDEVIGQLIKATGCSSPRAEALAWEVHTRGKALVFDGPMNNCLQVSSILEEIGLHTTIEV